MYHPNQPNKKGLYVVSCQNNNTYKVENYINDNNYTITVQDRKLTISSSTMYGLGIIEDLGMWGNN